MSERVTQVLRGPLQSMEPGDLIEWAVRTKRISPARSRDYFRAAANGEDVSVLRELTPAPADVAASWVAKGPQPPQDAEFAEFDHLFPPCGVADSAETGSGSPWATPTKRHAGALAVGVASADDPYEALFPGQA
jgi:hypothetical protein